MRLLGRRLDELTATNAIAKETVNITLVGLFTGLCGLHHSPNRPTDREHGMTC